MAVIEVKNLWKKFRLYYEKKPSLKEMILLKGRGKWEEFWVLKDINLKIERGTTVGLIGENGSGKSTLLKLLTKILYPDKGEVKLTGRVSSLLELGAGFHPDFTGRENIYFNSSVFGLTKSEIDIRMDEIIHFSELEEFIDNPVRSYSSGMYMRLAFASAINVDPDILLIDEVLAVGDSSFQKKCMDKIKEFKNKGKTIVFVSHDNGTVEKLCDSAIWLNNGQVIQQGDVRKVVDTYLLHMEQKDDFRLAKEHREQENVRANLRLEEIEEAKVNGNKSEETVREQFVSEERWGNRNVELTGIKMLNQEGKVKFAFNSGEDVIIVIDFKVAKQTYDYAFGIGIWRNDGIMCYGTNTYIDKAKLGKLPQKGTLHCSIKGLNLTEGTYVLDIAIHSEDGLPYDYWRGCYRFSVNSRIKDVGVTRLEHEWIMEN